MHPLVSKLFAWAPFLQVVVLSLGTLVSFLVAYYKNDVTIYLPFISENGAIIPEMGIFSSTLMAGSFIGVFTAAFRYLMIDYIQNQQGNVNPKLNRLNILSLLCGLGSMAGLAGVAAFPMSTMLVVHLIVAGIHFSLAMVYLFVNTFLSYHTKSSNFPPVFMKTRIILCILITIFLILLTTCMPFAYFKWRELHPKTMPSMKTPEDEGFTLLFLSALFEWSLYITFMTYIMLFLFEFRKFQLVLYVEPVGTLPKDLKNGDTTLNDI